MKARTAYTTDFTALARHLDIRLLQALGDQTWLAEDRTGLKVVLKCGPGAGSDVYDFLIKCNSLFPSFDYPRIISAEPGFYLLYKYIEGLPLQAGEFESEANLAAAFDLSGRVTALCRSLKLAPMFQGLNSKAAPGENPNQDGSHHLATLGSNLDYRMDNLAVRRSESCRSYAWGQEVVEYVAAGWPEGDAGVIPWEPLRQRVETVTSIHLTVQGSSLAHTRFTPEHILLTGCARWGLVGWQVAPRPYNYMRYRFLSWCLVHSVHGEIEKRCRHYLKIMPTIHASAANALTFALCLLETWVETRQAIERRDEKLQAVSAFIHEALAATAADTAA